eukprot:TRINITY_DN18276_c0_g1_i1.p1 TRINITY_DN18276_c0_g1~~TRINITY_DN18276_c0_g1_i1.p1  ORF type:complete len:192 (-),score=18.94 TRINITY_DN18276_c0_g1_i1:455-1030(-)
MMPVLSTAINSRPISSAHAISLICFISLTEIYHPNLSYSDMAGVVLFFVGIIPFALAVHLGFRVDTQNEQMDTTTHHIDPKTSWRPKGFILSLSQPYNEGCLSDVQEGLREHIDTNLCAVDDQSISIEMLNRIRISCNSTWRYDALHPGSTAVEKKTPIAAIRVALASKVLYEDMKCHATLRGYQKVTVAW